MSRLQIVLNYLKKNQDPSIEMQVVSLWIETAVDGVLRSIYNGYITTGSATVILQCPYPYLCSCMEKKYGPNWEDIAALNFSINRNGD